MLLLVVGFFFLIFKFWFHLFQRVTLWLNFDIGIVGSLEFVGDTGCLCLLNLVMEESACIYVECVINCQRNERFEMSIIFW